MKPHHILIANTVTWLAVLATLTWIFLTDAEGNPRLPDITTMPVPKHAPRTITAHDGAECKLWPLESRYGHPDPHFFWLCPGAGPRGTDRWGLAWDFNDVNVEAK